MWKYVCFEFASLRIAATIYINALYMYRSRIAILMFILCFWSVFNGCDGLNLVGMEIGFGY